MTIQYAKRDDLATIAAFIDEAWKSAYAGILSADFLQNLNTKWRYERFCERFDSGESQFLIMYECGAADGGSANDNINGAGSGANSEAGSGVDSKANGTNSSDKTSVSPQTTKLIGAAIVGKSTIEGYLPDGEISAIYLHPQYIGKGYGHILFERAEQTLAKMGHTNFILDVFAENVRAINFYQAHGYVQVGENHLNLGGVDYPCVVFRKRSKASMLEPKRKTTLVESMALSSQILGGCSMKFDMKQLAYCGIYCEQCSFKVAAETQERKHLLNMPQRYDAHKQQVLTELSCPGCKGEAICGGCKMKTCVEQKGLDSCADCEAFPCKVLLDFSDDGVPHHKWALENLQAIRVMGAEAWFDQLKPALNCDCGERQSWYYECSACGVAKAAN